MEREGRTLADVPGLLRGWAWPRAAEPIRPAPSSPPSEPQVLHFTEAELRAILRQRDVDRIEWWRWCVLLAAFLALILPFVVVRLISGP